MSPNSKKAATLSIFAAACLAILIAPALAPAQTVAATSTGRTSTGIVLPAGFGDREILGVLQTINLGEVNAAQTVQTRASSKAVKEFAQDMIREHRKGEDGVHAAVGVVGATRTSALSNQLADQNKESLKRLTTEKGNDFDRDYMAEQVKAHQMVLDLIDHDLMPRASNAKVKSLLTTTRAMVAEHLQEAKALQAKLPAA